MVPSAIVVMGSLPLTANGKLDRYSSKPPICISISATWPMSPWIASVTTSCRANTTRPAIRCDDGPAKAVSAAIATGPEPACLHLIESRAQSAVLPRMIEIPSQVCSTVRVTTLRMLMNRKPAPSLCPRTSPRKPYQCLITVEQCPCAGVLSWFVASKIARTFLPTAQYSARRYRRSKQHQRRFDRRVGHPAGYLGCGRAQRAGLVGEQKVRGYRRNRRKSGKAVTPPGIAQTFDRQRGQRAVDRLCRASANFRQPALEVRLLEAVPAKRSL